MKSFTLVLLSAGLVSAAAPPTPVIFGGANAINLTGTADSSAASSAAAAAASQVASIGGAHGINLGNLGNIGSSGSSGVSSALSGLNLGSLSVGGLDLGSVNLNSQNDLLNAIELMLGALCLNNLIDANILGQLSQSADIEMFLELAQLMQLEESGLINLVQIQSLFSGNSLFNNFQLGVFKRAINDYKKTMTTRTKMLRRGSRAKRQRSQNCAAVSSGSGTAVSSGNAAEIASPSAVASEAVSAPPAEATSSVAAPPAEASSSASASAAPPPPAAASAAPAADDSDLSDFTR